MGEHSKQLSKKMIKMIIILIISFICCISCIAMNKDDLTVLRQFQTAFDCRTDWCLAIKSITPHCPLPTTPVWAGLQCNNNGSVTELQVKPYSLEVFKPTRPGGLVNLIDLVSSLTSMTTLTLRSNNINQRFSFSHISFVKRLDISKNRMYAPLNCAACAFELLNISYNRFTGDADRVDTFQQSQRVIAQFNDFEDRVRVESGTQFLVSSQPRGTTLVESWNGGDLLEAWRESTCVEECRGNNVMCHPSTYQSNCTISLTPITAGKALKFQVNLG